MANPYFSPRTFAFLEDLRENNDRAWFEANKARYERDVRAGALAFIVDFAPRLEKVSRHFRADPRKSGGSLFRIHRDTRFSRDKSPYKTHAGIQFRHRQGRDAHAPGFYLHLDPAGSFAGVGTWHPDGPALRAIRDAIVEDGAGWRAAREGGFAAAYALAGDTLTRAPRGYDPSHPLIEDLKRKDFIGVAELTRRRVTGAGFMDDFEALWPGRCAVRALALPGRRARVLTPTSWPDHFSDSAERYARFRPTYPPALFDLLAELAPERDLAWDCATGTGQAAAALGARFARVVATDASAGQVGRAQAAPRVSYAVALAEASPIRAARVDLITVAQAAHWLDLEEFFVEARRVLRPHGVLALWTYGLCRVTPGIDRVLDRFYRQVVGPYWPPERSLVDSLYRDLRLPLAEVRCEPPPMRHRWTRAQLLGYVDTWSAVKRYRKERGTDPVAGELAPLLRRLWPGEERLAVRWPLGLRVGRAP